MKEICQNRKKKKKLTRTFPFGLARFRFNEVRINEVPLYSVLPRALADPDGNPHKSTKSKWTDKLKVQYRTYSSTPFVSVPPWVPDVANVDAMFPLNTTPLRQHKTITDYAYLLFRISAMPHFNHGTKEVHLVLDHPERFNFNP